MKILEPVFIEVIEKLLLHHVEFILIGGYAVNYYGYGRYTGDIDFWLRPDEENKSRFLHVFSALCADTAAFETIKTLDFALPQAISLGEPPLRVDFLTKVNLVEFEDAWERKAFLPMKDMQVPMVHYYHLITMKMNTGRPKDQLDIDQLQRINQLKHKQ